MNKYKLRHRILEEIYKVPENPVSEKYTHWIDSTQLKNRIKGDYSESFFKTQLKYLHGKKEIILTKYNDGTINLNQEKEGAQAYLDCYYLDKSREETRKTTQHYFQVVAWVVGISLGVATFILNLRKLNQDIYIVPLLEHRIDSLEIRINQKVLDQSSTIHHSNTENKKDSLNALCGKKQ
jgi:hypothetical protein